MSGAASAVFSEAREEGPLARIDPRARLLGALAFLLVLATLDVPPTLGLALAAGVAAALLARLEPGPTFRRLAAVEGFLVVLLISLPLTVPGSAAAHVFGLPLSWDGFARAAVIAVRVNAAILMIAALLSRMGATRLSEAMVGIGIPARIAVLCQLTVRYLAVFQDEYRRLRRAMLARGFRPRSDRLTWESLGNLIGLLILRSAERAERVAWAMRARGFSGTVAAGPRAPLGRADALFLGAMAALCALLLALEFGA
ncbi:cobalt ECF transporter T component CbiQ [Acuticoccus kandeliae]|uniref:cobalt ECF transporter T component CbiQ n=1 Tax=Acuticoccus kandeliae TaxID=2073160 RepID=UPI000D3E078C|nr:cobalt ECF transporter T component CbiQ [Acuticoccus kandeliae]